MAEITIHTGFVGDQNVINIDSYDHNNVQYKDTIAVVVEPEDKPRRVTVIINGRTV